VARTKRISQAYRHSTIMLDVARRRSLQTGKSFDLDREWILDRLIIGKCEVTGIEFEFGKHGDKRRFNRLAPSLDRVDSLRGYTKDNCQVVIAHYNFAKGQWSADDLDCLAVAITNRKSQK
jgi:hypothetical protein